MTPSHPEPVLPPLPARWYSITRYGMATLCASEQDAISVAEYSNGTWPSSGPHRAVQLVDAAAIAAERDAATAHASALAQRVDELEALAAEIPQLVARADKAHESELALIEKLAGLERDLAAMTTARDVAVELGATYAARMDELAQENQRLQAESNKLLRNAITFADVIANHCIAMQSAVVEMHIGKGAEAAMVWIENTLIGPGLYPDIGAAEGMGGAQAWFDAKTAEHEAFRAKHPGTDDAARKGEQKHG